MAVLTLMTSPFYFVKDDEIGTKNDISTLMSELIPLKKRQFSEGVFIFSTP